MANLASSPPGPSLVLARMPGLYVGPAGMRTMFRRPGSGSSSVLPWQCCSNLHEVSVKKILITGATGWYRRLPDKEWGSHLDFLDAAHRNRLAAFVDYVIKRTR